MAQRRVYGLLHQLENDQNLQTRIDAVEARVERTFAVPAQRELASLGRQQRSRSDHPACSEEQSGRRRL